MMADGENFEDWCAFVCEEVCRAAPKKGIVQRFLHHSCQQFAQTVNGQPLWRRGLQRRCCPGRGRGDIFRAAGDGKVGAVRHLLRTEPGPCGGRTSSVRDPRLSMGTGSKTGDCA